MLDALVLTVAPTDGVLASTVVAASLLAYASIVVSAGVMVGYLVGYVLAADTDVDHIVMGSHGRTGRSRIIMGSVAENAVRRAPIPVTIVR